MVARLSLLCLALSAFVSVASGEENVPPKGFTALFDGKDLKGWKGGSTADPRKITPEQQAAWDKEVPEHWKVEDGQLVSDGHGPHLVTDKDYGDFELWVDWKLSPKGDSGIYIRDTPQVQLWDPTNEEAHQHVLTKVQAACGTTRRPIVGRAKWPTSRLASGTGCMCGWSATR
jgi:hypothetical protein